MRGVLQSDVIGEPFELHMKYLNSVKQCDDIVDIVKNAK